MTQPTAKPKTKKDARDIRAEALKIANSIKVDGQDKAETKAIANGIQRGIEMFMRQQSEKARDLDKRVKKVKQLTATVARNNDTSTTPVVIPPKSSRLPWVLLTISWIFFVAMSFYFYN